MIHPSSMSSTSQLMSLIIKHVKIFEPTTWMIWIDPLIGFTSADLWSCNLQKSSVKRVEVYSGPTIINVVLMDCPQYTCIRACFTVGLMAW